MFGIGFPEMILILALALIVVGPDKLPDFARSIAKTLLDLKKTAEGLKDNLTIEGKPLSEINSELEDAAHKFKRTVLDTETHAWKNGAIQHEESANTSGASSNERLEPPAPAGKDGDRKSTNTEIIGHPNKILDDDSPDLQKPA